MKFTLGTQTATAVTDSTGFATAPLTLTQKPGAYSLTSTYLGDGNYLASSSGPATFGIPNGTGAVPMIALMGANQTWASALKRLVARTGHTARSQTVHRLARRAK